MAASTGAVLTWATTVMVIVSVSLRAGVPLSVDDYANDANLPGPCDSVGVQLKTPVVG